MDFVLFLHWTLFPLFSLCNFLGNCLLWNSFILCLDIFFLWLQSVSYKQVMGKSNMRVKDFGDPLSASFSSELPLLFSVFPVSWFHFSGYPIHKDWKFSYVCLHLCAVWTVFNPGYEAMETEFIFIAPLSPTNILAWTAPPPPSESICFVHSLVSSDSCLLYNRFYNYFLQVLLSSKILVLHSQKQKLIHS